METCTVETGLLKKKPCGEASVTHCANCEQPLCAKHAVAELSAAGKKTGKFMCKECSAAQREHDKALAKAPPAEKPKPAAAKAAPSPAPKPAPPAQKPAAQPKAPPPPDEKSGPNYGGIDFTPAKKE